MKPSPPLPPSPKPSDDTNWLVGQLAHEIRTPLTSILGYTDLLVDDLQGLPGSLAKLHMVRRNGKALLRLTQDITSLCQFNSGDIPPKPTHFSPTELAADILNLYALKAARKRLKLAATVDVDEPVPDEIEMDQDWLRRIMTNLIDNAVKFTNTGGIELRMGFREAAAASQKLTEGRLVLSVVDTGVGVDAENQEKIFHPFFSADRSERDRLENTGLGLAITRRLVELAGGEIMVSRGEACGSG